MAEPTTSARVDLDDLERPMRELAMPGGGDDRLVGVNRRSRAAERTDSSGSVQPGVGDGIIDEGAPGPDEATDRDCVGSADRAFDGEVVGRAPFASDAAGARRASKEPGLRSPRALALGLPLVLACIAVGAAMITRTGPMAGSGSKAPVPLADEASVQRAKIATSNQPPDQSASAATGSVTPDQPGVDGVTRPASPVEAVMQAPSAAAIVTTDISRPDVPQVAAESSPVETPHRALAVSVEPDATIASRGKPEVAPLPPTKPRMLASAAATMGAETVRPKPSDVSSDATAGPASYSIQLSSSPLRSDAIATLSRLRKRFPGIVGGGTVSRADLGGKGVFYRVQVGSLSRAAAEKMCSQLRANRENCIVTRG
jgi:hypothetical protein